jgi:hypothetical protein
MHRTYVREIRGEDGPAFLIPNSSFLIDWVFEGVWWLSAS